MSSLIVERKNEFDLEVVLRGLQKCRQLDGSILLDEYLFAFKELCRYLYYKVTYSLTSGCVKLPATLFSNLVSIKQYHVY